MLGETIDGEEQNGVLKKLWPGFEMESNYWTSNRNERDSKILNAFLDAIKKYFCDQKVCAVRNELTPQKNSFQILYKSEQKQ